MGAKTHCKIAFWCCAYGPPTHIHAHVDGYKSRMPDLSPTHSTVPTGEWLVTQYALGQLPRAAAVLAEAYMDMHPAARATAQRIEQVGGWSLETVEPSGLSTAMTATAVLERIRKQGEAEETAAADAQAAKANDLPGTHVPASLARAVGQPIGALPWKWRGRGVYEHRLRSLEDNGIVARLLRIEPGRAVPQHSHDGLEATLVLSGAYRDDAGRFAAGDLELADGSVDHKPIAEPGVTCICFAVNEAPMRFTGPVGKLFQALFSA